MAKPPLTPQLEEFARQHLTPRAKVVLGLVRGAGWRELDIEDYELPLAELDGWGFVNLKRSKRRGYLMVCARQTTRPRARRQ